MINMISHVAQADNQAITINLALQEQNTVISMQICAIYLKTHYKKSA